MRHAITLAAATFLGAGLACAQPTMESLWPNDDGMRWEYLFHVFDHDGDIDFTSPAHLQFAGAITTPGGEAQVLLAEHDDIPWPARSAPPALPPLLAAVWRARPDLREGIARLAPGSVRQTWQPNLLHGGPFMMNADRVIMWQEIWTHPTWLYLEDEIAPGATFSMQLVPEIADDIWLYGTVAELDATVATPVGVFDDAVKVDYLVDFGIQIVTDEGGEIIGEVESEISGHVHYAPQVGPVELLEEYYPFLSIDCGGEDCPPEWVDMLGVVEVTYTLSLTRLPVANEPATWGAVKSIYR
jgi:hypothetical protein